MISSCRETPSLAIWQNAGDTAIVPSEGTAPRPVAAPVSDPSPGPVDLVDLTVSVVNTNNAALLRGCLETLFARTKRSMEVYVVDNASTDGSADMVQREFPAARLLVNAQRKGFSANHNMVAGRARGRFVALLNEDLLIHDGALDRLVAFLEARPDVAVVGPQVLNPDGSFQPCAFDSYTIGSVLLDFAVLPSLIPKGRWFHLDGREKRYEERDVDWILGACLVMRREAVQSVGLLDEQISPIIYSEEVDWCYRARQMGWKVAYCPAATLVHYGGQTTRRQSVRMQLELYRTRFAFFRKHHGRRSEILLRAGLTSVAALNTVVLSLQLLKGLLLLRPACGLFVQRLSVVWRVPFLTLPRRSS